MEMIKREKFGTNHNDNEIGDDGDDAIGEKEDDDEPQQQQRKNTLNEPPSFATANKEFT